MSVRARLLALPLAAFACGGDHAAVADTSSSSTTSTSGDTTSTSASDASTSTSSADSTSEGSSSSSSSHGESGYVPPVCGDGVVEGDEECEDGNREPDDGCDNACNHSGVLLWSMDWDGPAGTNDGARGLALAGDGGFVVVGYEGVAGNGADAFVSRRAADGSEIWHRSHDESGGSDEATRVVFDADGGVVAIGYTTTSDVTSAWIRRYDADGNESWTFADAGVDGVGAQGLDVADDGAGTLYAALTQQRMSGASEAIVVVLDGQLGTAIDTWTFAAAGFDTRGRGVAFDGGVLFLANEATASEGTNAVLRRLDTTGNEVWNVVERGEGALTDEAGRALQLASNGDIVVVGEVDREGQGSDVWTARYDADGAPSWTRTFHLSPDVDDQANDADVDEAGEVYVTGAVAMPGQSFDLFARRYSADGEAELWTSTWDDPGAHLVDEGHAILVVADGVIVAGVSSIPGAGENAMLRKYAR